MLTISKYIQSVFLIFCSLEGKILGGFCIATNRTFRNYLKCYLSIKTSPDAMNLLVTAFAANEKQLLISKAWRILSVIFNFKCTLNEVMVNLEI